MDVARPFREDLSHLCLAHAAEDRPPPPAAKITIPLVSKSAFNLTKNREFTAFPDKTNRVPYPIIRSCPRPDLFLKAVFPLS